MKEVAINSTTIRKYVDILTEEECDILYNYTYNKTNNPVPDPSAVPWEIKGKTNTLYYYCVDDQSVRDIINKYKYAIAEEMTKIEGVSIYPHLTTIVLWKPGQQMPRHVDNGSGHAEREAQLGMRYSTSVTYLNDNFKGGYTFVRNDGVDDTLWRTDSRLSFPNDVFEDYISIPEKGATITFYASDKNAHGVSQLEEGDRIVLSTWFTKDPQYKENDAYYISLEDHEAGMQNQLKRQSTEQNWNK